MNIRMNKKNWFSQREIYKFSTIIFHSAEEQNSLNNFCLLALFPTIQDFKFFFHHYSRRLDLWSEVSFLLFDWAKKKLNAISRETQKRWENLSKSGLRTKIGQFCAEISVLCHHKTSEISTFKTNGKFKFFLFVDWFPLIFIFFQMFPRSVISLVLWWESIFYTMGHFSQREPDEFFSKLLFYNTVGVP